MSVLPPARPLHALGRIAASAAVITQAGIAVTGSVDSGLRPIGLIG